MCEVKRAKDGGVSKRNREIEGLGDQMTGVASGEMGRWLGFCVEQPHDAERVEQVRERGWEEEGGRSKGEWQRGMIVGGAA
jgi:hypothetical protein